VDAKNTHAAPLPPRQRRAAKVDRTLAILAATLVVVLVTLVTLLYVIYSGTSMGTTDSGISVAAGNLTKVDSGAPGCADTTGDVCYSVNVTVTLPSGDQFPLTLTDLGLSIQSTGPANETSNGSYLKLPAAAAVHAVNRQGPIVANSGWVNGFSGGFGWVGWTGQFNLPVVPGVTLIFDSGLTTTSLSGDYLWFEILIPESGASAVELP